jgi:hypothetical protein
MDAQRKVVLAGAGIAAAAALIRAPGLFSDLWLDEIWSLDSARAASSWTDIFLRIHLDNNHHLNTLYLWAIGDSAPPVLYRMLAFVSGVVSVLVAWRLAAREGRLAAGVTAVTFSLSHLLVYYSSEARGYAPAVLFSLLAWGVLQRHAEQPSWRYVLAFTGCALLGVMAHRTVGFFLVGAYVWYDAEMQQRHRVREATRLTWRTFSLPVVSVAAFAAVSLRNTMVGGGLAYRLDDIAAQALSNLVGGPTGGPLMWIAAGLVAVLFAAALWQRWQAGDRRWILYATTVVLLPLILGLAGRPETLSARYFIVPAAFALLAVSIFLGRGLADGGRRRLLARVSLAVVVGLGAASMAERRTSNRGQYRRAFAEMLTAAGDQSVTVASAERFGGHAFRTRTVLNYYRRTSPMTSRLLYVEPAEYPPSGTDWIIVESPEARPGEPSHRDRYARLFDLHRDYLAPELSGVNWHLYRQADRPGPQRVAEAQR